MTSRNDLLQAKFGSRMLARAEAESWIENHDLLARARGAATPARFDQQTRSDLNRAEMPLPGVCPIFTFDGSTNDLSGTDVESTASDSGDTVAQLCSCLGSIDGAFKIYTHG